MKILLFTENTHKGGLDSFIVNLVRAWPNADDEFCVLVNALHPGLGELRLQLLGRAQVAAHGAPAYVDLVLRASSRWTWLRRLVALPLRASYLVRGIRSLEKTFSETGADRMMIVSGGYPGGDTCLSAVLAWSRGGLRPPPTLSVHNLARRAPFWNLPASCWEYWMDRRITKEVGTVVAVSRACAHSMRIRPVLWGGAPITFIFNGVEEIQGGTNTGPSAPERDSIRKEFGFDADAPVCIMLATYEARKGHEFLFDVFCQVLRVVPSARLIVCGFGIDAEYRRIMFERDRRGLSRQVILEGFRLDAMRLLAATDLLAVPSQSFESFGLTCIEAMARRVPVLATNVGGLPEVVVDGDGGYVIEHNDVVGFAACMTALLNDPELRRQQGEKGRRRFERLFRAPQMALQYANLLIEGKLPVYGRINQAEQ